MVVDEVIRPDVVGMGGLDRHTSRDRPTPSARMLADLQLAAFPEPMNPLLRQGFRIGNLSLQLFMPLGGDTMASNCADGAMLRYSTKAVQDGKIVETVVLAARFTA